MGTTSRHCIVALCDRAGDSNENGNIEVEVLDKPLGCRPAFLGNRNDDAGAARLADQADAHAHEPRLVGGRE
jgi:hypothetical protein